MPVYEVADGKVRLTALVHYGRRVKRWRGRKFVVRQVREVRI